MRELDAILDMLDRCQIPARKRGPELTIEVAGGDIIMTFDLADRLRLIMIVNDDDLDSLVEPEPAPIPTPPLDIEPIMREIRMAESLIISPVARGSLGNAMVLLARLACNT